jgi:hypothetical protein
VSTLNVDKVDPSTGTDLELGTSGDTVTIPSGVTITNSGTDGGGFGTALTGSTNNTITTVTGANAISGETNLTFDGTNLTVATGDIIMGTAGKGIDFSATSDSSGTTQSEVFDDYEEGIFTCTFSFGTSGTCAIDTNYDTGMYRKIGDIVFVSGRLIIGGPSSPLGAWYVDGLPFVASNAGGEGQNVWNGTVQFQLIDYTAGAAPTTQTYGNLSKFYFTENISGGYATVQGGALSVSDEMNFAFWYRAA